MNICMTIYVYPKSEEYKKKKKKKKRMTVEKLERVLWRVRKRNPDKKEIKLIELQRAIMYECGTDPKTIRHNKAALVRLGWITSHKKLIRLTDKDITGE